MSDSMAQGGQSHTTPPGISCIDAVGEPQFSHG
jgi:hypothetical protein